ncbi:puff II/9-2 protein-like [Drosophila willistoni]|uniref:puff II/9-2 protein-like n=1 Tax=Drosophila willistoni TaxID=7260 RepID=UPI001F08837F|nr:puff II/9-2 protein-like [Drosophila willistoni]
MDDHGECGFSSDEEDLCALYCHRSMKFGLAYIIELKEKIKILEENHSGSENSQLSKAVESLQSKIDQQNIQIANINDFITNSVRQKEVDEKAKSQTEIDNLKRKVEQLKESSENVQRQAAQDKEESLAEQINKNREIENLKEKLATQKSDLDKAIKDLESKNKDFEEYQTKEKNSNNKIGELNYEISSLQKKLEEYETQLTDSNHLVEKHSLRLNQTKEYLIECQKRIPKPSCKVREQNRTEQRTEIGLISIS